MLPCTAANQYPISSNKQCTQVDALVACILMLPCIAAMMTREGAMAYAHAYTGEQMRQRGQG